MRILVTVALGACFIQNATAAELVLAKPLQPAPAAARPEWYPSRYLQQGIFFEMGARYWFSSGTYSKDLFGGSSVGLLSRLTYSGLTSHAAEWFGSVKQVDGYFLRWNIGLGKTVGGTLIDEDFDLPVPPFSASYSRTTSEQREGSLGYATIDLGFNIAASPTWQLGPFVGFHFLRETMNAAGCVQQANNLDICVPPIPAGVRGITQRADWYSIRLGIGGEWNVTDRFKVSANAAWLPFTRLDAADAHLLRIDLSGGTPEGGTGGGVQLEGIASYALSDSFNVGVGARYWYMQAQGEADFTRVGGIAQPLETKTDRFGVFLQGVYSFAVPGKHRRSPWLACC
jgi:hypothetical protein